MGPAAIPIAIGLSAAAAGYGVYAGERARSDSARQYNEQKQMAMQQRKEDQARLAQNKVDEQALYDRQVSDQKSTDADLRAQQDASLAKVRGEVPGMEAKLGEDLLAQQEHAYSRMAPQLENRLNALGLLQSGALPEAQAKYQGDLESQRQAALASFRSNADQQLNINQPLANSSADVGRQYDALNNNLTTRRDNLSQDFATQNANDINDVARQQYLSGLASANNAAAQSSANAYLNFGGQVGSGLINYYGNKAAKPNASMSALYNMRNTGGWSGTNGGYAAYA